MTAFPSARHMGPRERLHDGIDCLGRLKLVCMAIGVSDVSSWMLFGCLPLIIDRGGKILPIDTFVVLAASLSCSGGCDTGSKDVRSSIAA